MSVNDAAPTRHNRFETLRAGRPGTAALWVPLTIWDDHFGDSSESIRNYHEDFFGLYIVRSGRGIHRIEDRDYQVARGDVYVMPPGAAHRYISGENLCLAAIHFTLDLFDAADRVVLLQSPGVEPLLTGGRWLHLSPGALTTVEGILHELRNEWDAGTPTGALLVRAHFARLLVLLARRSKQAVGEVIAQRPGVEATVANAIRYLDIHFAEPLRIEQVASVVGLSPDRFTEVFAQIMGRTPSNYLRHLRTEHALQLLHKTDDTLSTIARAAGFADAAHLARTIRAITGKTPTDHRRNTQARSSSL